LFLVAGEDVDERGLVCGERRKAAGQKKRRENRRVSEILEDKSDSRMGLSGLRVAGLRKQIGPDEEREKREEKVTRRERRCAGVGEKEEEGG